VRLLAPLVPPIILNSGQNYWDHRDEKPPVDAHDPEFFLKAPLAVIGPDEPIILDPAVTSKLDEPAEREGNPCRRGRGAAIRPSTRPLSADERGRRSTLAHVHELGTGHQRRVTQVYDIAATSSMEAHRTAWRW
jgi:hypothetical protein